MFTDRWLVATCEGIKSSPVEDYERSRAVFRQLPGNSVGPWLFVVCLTTSVFLNSFKVNRPADEGGGFLLEFYTML